MNAKAKQQRVLPVPAPSKGLKNLEDAYHRGQNKMQKIWSSSEILTPFQVRERLHKPQRTLSQLRRKRMLIGIKTQQQREYRYPKWQFDEQVLRGVQEVMMQLSNFKVSARSSHIDEAFEVYGGIKQASSDAVASR